jgi:threonine dehydrogenase-like Zn-dependent dehydrogenase
LLRGRNSDWHGAERPPSNQEFLAGPEKTLTPDRNNFVLAFMVSNKKLTAVHRPLPKVLAGWALIRVRMAGICNTDVEILRGYHDFRGVPGHEFVGEVVEVRGVSVAVRKKWVGKRVTGEINIHCSAFGYKPVCQFCKRGLVTHCARRKVLGIVGQNGAFAEYLTLPVENLHLVPGGVSDELAVFVEPLAAACEILKQVRVREFREAAVLGDGKLAQLIARVLRTALPRVVMYGKHAGKLGLARAARVETRKVRGDARDLQKIKEQYRLVVEATGSANGLALAQHLTEARGTIVLKSTFHGAAVVETWPMVVKEITVVGSRCGPFGDAIVLLRSRGVAVRELVSRVFPLREAAEAILFAQRGGVMKVLLAAGEKI